MTIELFYLTAQIQHWVNVQIAHHLEAQAAKLEPAPEEVSPGGPMALRKLGAGEAGVSAAEFGRIGMSGCYGPADESENFAGVDHVARRCPAAQRAMRDSEKHTVRA